MDPHVLLDPEAGQINEKLESDDITEEKPLIPHRKKASVLDIISIVLDYMLYSVFIIFIIAMIIICYYFGPGAPPSDLLKLDIDALVDPTFQPIIPEIFWIDDNNYLVLNETAITKGTIVNNNLNEVVIVQQKDYPFSSPISWSFNQQYLLIPVNVIPRWRHSFNATYLVWDLKNPTNPFVFLGNYTQSVILNAQWSKNNLDIAFVKDNSVYVVSGPNFDDPGVLVKQGTDAVEYGTMSWVYEEEVFSDYNAIWWAPANSTYDGFVFFESDSTGVNTFGYPIYDTSLQKPPYSTIVNLKYPQAGTPNPIVSLWYYNTTSKNSVTINSGNDEYITDLYWPTSDFLLIKTVNRNQDQEITRFYDFPTNNLRTLVNETLTPVNGSQVGWIYPRPYSIIFNSSDYNSFWMIKNCSGHFHIYSVDDIKNTQGPKIQNLTCGAWDVLELLSYNPNLQRLYYASTENSNDHSDPTQSHIYFLGNTQRTGLTTGTTAYYTASFSPNGVNYILNYMGPQIPYTELHSSTADPQEVSLIASLEKNSELSLKLSQYAMPTKAFTTGLSADGVTPLLVTYIRPPVLSPAIYYPTIFDVYGGPESQSVTQAWSLGFDEFLASQGIIIYKVDPRGTANRGLDFMYQVYGSLGEKEAQDVISIASQFSSAPYVDNGRMGIWGWSFGGFMALNTIIKGGASVFQMAISVAPVTDWRLYDTFYTERFMSTPHNNPAGYNSTSVIDNCSKLKNLPFLVVHGTGDDNVHFQNTALLNERLVELGIQYDTMFYTNKQHSIQTAGARPHLYHLLYNFINQNLAGLPQVRQEVTNN